MTNKTRLVARLVWVCVRVAVIMYTLLVVAQILDYRKVREEPARNVRRTGGAYYRSSTNGWVFVTAGSSYLTFPMEMDTTGSSWKCQRCAGKDRLARLVYYDTGPSRAGYAYASALYALCTTCWGDLAREDRAAYYLARHWNDFVPPNKESLRAITHLADQLDSAIMTNRIIFP